MGRWDDEWIAIDRDHSSDGIQKDAKRKALRERIEAVEQAERAQRVQQRAQDHVAFQDTVRELKADKPIISSPISGDEARALLTLSPVTTDWLVDGLIPLGVSTVLGPGGVGKSRLLFELGYHVALGRPWHGAAVRQGNVLIFTDSSREAVERTMNSIAAEIGVPDWRSIDAFKIVDGLPEMIGNDVVFQWKGKQYYIHQWYDAVKNPVLVGVDPLSGVKRTTKDKDNQELLFQLIPPKGALLATHRVTGRDDGQGKSLNRLPQWLVQREITVHKDRLILHRGAAPAALTVLPPDARRLYELIPANGDLIQSTPLRKAFGRDNKAFKKAEAPLLAGGWIERLPDYPHPYRRLPLLLPAPQVAQ
jgi:hypothetical protein